MSRVTRSVSMGLDAATNAYFDERQKELLDKFEEQSRLFVEQGRLLAQANERCNKLSSEVNELTIQLLAANDELARVKAASLSDFTSCQERMDEMDETIKSQRLGLLNQEETLSASKETIAAQGLEIDDPLDSRSGGG